MLKKLLWDWIPQRVQDNLILRYIGFFKIPLVNFVGLKMVKRDEKKCTLSMPLNRKTKNHVNSVYFACMTAGADLTAGFPVILEILRIKKNIVPIFKDMSAEFYKRAEGETHFTSEQNQEIKDLIQKALSTGERHNIPVIITATVPKVLGDEPVAKFTLNLSLKVKS
ncbi:MAG: DUF4442 domain-containing protein [Bdellovibrionota bacterium]|nr:DUF4442 domain-containing protein [Bdellovibrionota bacterium]